nr:MAG TPA: hypothetical protein [Caudoviricetes sp.]
MSYHIILYITLYLGCIRYFYFYYTCMLFHTLSVNIIYVVDM